MTLHKHHKIPRHAGGTDDPSNLVELTVEEHAEAHKKLWEEHGCWQDELAWKALSGIIGKEEIIKLSQSKGGKLGAEKVIDIYGTERIRKLGLSNHGMKHSKEERLAKSIRQKNIPKSKEHKEKISKAHCKNTYEIIFPNGDKEVINNLKKFCIDHDLVRWNMCAVIAGKDKSHRGFAGRKL